MFVIENVCTRNGCSAGNFQPEGAACAVLVCVPNNIKDPNVELYNPAPQGDHV